jgi:hypothetical protein
MGIKAFEFERGGKLYSERAIQEREKKKQIKFWHTTQKKQKRNEIIFLSNFKIKFFSSSFWGYRNFCLWKSVL